MENKTVGVIEVEVDGIDRIQELIDELTEHLQAAQSAIDSLGTVKLDIKPKNL